MNHIIILNDGRKVEVQKVEEYGGSLKIRMLLQTSDQLKSYFADAFSTKKIIEKDDGKETVYKVTPWILKQRETFNRYFDTHEFTEEEWESL